MVDLNKHVLEDEKMELAAKYLFVYLTHMVNKERKNCIVISNDELAASLGITKSRMYRARSQLVNASAIRHQHRFCQKTGKKVNNIYEIIE